MKTGCKFLLILAGLFYWMLGFSNPTWAATKFICSIQQSGGDYTSLDAWSDAIESDLTAAANKMAYYDEYDGDVTGIIDGEAVTWDAAASSGTIYHVTTGEKSGYHMVYLNIAVGTLDDNDIIDDGDGNTITIDGASDSAIAVAKIEGTWSVDDTARLKLGDVAWTTSATNYIHIYTYGDARHNGQWSNMAYRLHVTNNSTNPCIYNEVNYVRIDGLQLKKTESNANTYIGGFYNEGMSGAGDVRFTNNIVMGVLTGSASANGIYLNGGDSSTNVYVFGNIIYDWVNGTTQLAGIKADKGNQYVYNNTIHNSRIGIWRSLGNQTLTLKNTLVNDSTLQDFDMTGEDPVAASTHNVTNTTPDGNVNWGAKHEDSKVTDGVETDKLVDSSETFPNVVVGNVVENVTDVTYTYVTNVGEAGSGKLGVNDDIFVSGKTYNVYTNLYGAVTFVAEGSDNFHLAVGDTIAKDQGTDTTGEAAPLDDTPFEEDINDETKDTSNWDIGADEYYVPQTIDVCASGCDETTLGGVFASWNLSPGDAVEIEDGTYPASAAPNADDKGASGRIITIGAKAGHTSVNFGQQISILEDGIGYLKFHDLNLVASVAMAKIRIKNGDNLEFNNVEIANAQGGGNNGVIMHENLAPFKVITNITFDGCYVHDNGGTGITVTGVSTSNLILYGKNITITNCIIEGNTADGVTHTATANPVFTYNEFYGNGEEGIDLKGRWSNATIDFNIFHDGGTGIFLQGAPSDETPPFPHNAGMGGVRCRYNLLYNNTYHDINWQSFGDDGGAGTKIIAHNVIYNDDDDYRSIYIYRVNDVFVYNNSMYNGEDGVSIVCGQDITIRNNTTSGTSTYGLSHRTTANPCTGYVSANWDADHNNWDTDGTYMVMWHTGEDYTPAQMALYRSETGEGEESQSTDPKYVSATDLTLQSDSPLIDAGVDLGATYDDAIDPDSTWPDSVSTLDQDYYGYGWEMGAFVYEAATTYYIDFNAADDSGTGAIGDPWKYCPGMPDYTGDGGLIPGDTVYFDSADTWALNCTGDNYLLSITAGVTYIGDTWGAGTRAKLQPTTAAVNRNNVELRDIAGNVTFQGFEIDGNDLDGYGVAVNMNNPDCPDISNLVFDNLVIHNIGDQVDADSGGMTISGADTDGSYTANNVTIKNCYFYDIEVAGLHVYPATDAVNVNKVTNITIENNEFDNLNLIGTMDASVHLKNAIDTITFRYNEIHGDVTRDGLEIDNDSNAGGGLVNGSFYGNWIYDNTRRGVVLAIKEDSDFNFWANIIEDNAMEGLLLGTSSTADLTFKFHNNDFVGNMTSSGTYEFRIGESTATITTFDIKNNIFYMDNGKRAIADEDGNWDPTVDSNSYYAVGQTGGTIIAAIGGTSYKVSDAPAITVIDADAITSDPKMTDLANNSFTLQPDSPCVNAGTDLGTDFDEGLDPKSNWPSNVAVLDQDDYGAGWEIGAYVFLDQGYTEYFYARANGDGSAPESGIGAWDNTDLSNAGNYDNGVDANDGKIGANDIVYILDDDGIHRASLWPKGGGSVGKPTVFKNGSDEMPILSAADVITGWAQYSGNIYRAEVTTALAADRVWHGATELDEDDGGFATLALNEWDWVDDVTDYLYINVGGAPPLDVEATIRNYCVYISGDIDYLTFDGLIFEKHRDTGHGNFRTASGSIDNLTIQNCTSRYGVRYGFRIAGGVNLNTLIQNCVVHDNGKAGVNAGGRGINVSGGGGSSGNEQIYRYNDIYNNYNASGFSVTDSDYIFFYENDVHDNGENDFYGSAVSTIGTADHVWIYRNRISNHAGANPDGNGIITDIGSSYIYIFNNVIWGNDGKGICIWCSDYVYAYNNTLYGNMVDSGGDHVTFSDVTLGSDNGDDTTNVAFKNNIVWTTKASAVCIKVDAETANNAGIDIDYNHYYYSGGGATDWWSWAGTTGDTFAGWQSESSQDTNGSGESDPTFRDVSNQKFQLLPGSPCTAGTGVDLGDSYDDHLHPHPSSPVVPNVPWIIDPDLFGWTRGAYGYCSRPIVN